MYDVDIEIRLSALKVGCRLSAMVSQFGDVIIEIGCRLSKKVQFGTTAILRMYYRLSTLKVGCRLTELIHLSLETSRLKNNVDFRDSSS